MLGQKSIGAFDACGIAVKRRIERGIARLEHEVHEQPRILHIARLSQQHQAIAEHLCPLARQAKMDVGIGQALAQGRAVQSILAWKCPLAIIATLP